jgi:hypothetical protein
MSSVIPEPGQHRRAVHPQEFAKALVGAAVAALSALIPLMDDGQVSTQDSLAVILAALAGGGAVFGIPNKPPAAPRGAVTPRTTNHHDHVHISRTDDSADPGLSEQGAGEGRLILVIACGIVLGALLLILVRRA